MDYSLIKTHNQVAHGFSCNSQENLPLPNGITTNGDKRTRDDDLKRISFQSMSYTSLKDLLPVSPPSTVSPKTNRVDSWREIPIKNPLLQHAAWAYLQPMAETSENSKGGLLFQKLKEKCCGLFGCLNEVAMLVAGNWFCERSTVDDDDLDDYEVD